MTAILAGLAAALAAPLAQRRAPRAAPLLLGLVPLGTGCLLAWQHAVGPASGLREAHVWVPALGLNLSFALDGLALLFALLICGVGALVIVYSGGYFAGRAVAGRFQAFLLFFMAAMLGLVLADNVLLLFVFWELTGIASYLLIGFEHRQAAARRSALQALLVTGLGGLALLAGLLLLAQAGGSWELSELVRRGDRLRAHPAFSPALLLVLLGAFTKSAQFPFHFWLPNAMSAPTPASAYLHSATMVKAGVYLLARLAPALGDSDLWRGLVTATGAATMLLGAVLALRDADLKRVLAWSTVAALGTLTLLLGVGTAPAVTAAMALVVVHSLYKGALFLVAGAIDHGTGTRDLDRLSGLARAMPVVAVAGLLAGVSMIGLPPSLGFIAKELAYEAKLGAPHAVAGITLAGFLAGALNVAVALVAAVRPFVGPLRETPQEPHSPPVSLWAAPLVLAVLGLVFGLLPGPVAPVVGAAVTAVRGEPTVAELALWHGPKPALALSGAAFVAGAAAYAARGLLRRRLTSPGLAGLGADAIYERTLSGLAAVARCQTRVLQSGYLRHYLLVVLVTTVALAGFALWRAGAVPAARFGEVRLHEAAVAVLILGGAAAAVRSPSRLGAVAALGVVGYGVAMVYVLFGAPDLAMTQVLVDTLTVLLFVLVVYHLPRFARLSSPRARLRDALASLGAGALVALLVLAAQGGPRAAHVSAYYAEAAVPLAHGRNVVNVILVDFRALDTLGEVTVLAVAAIGVFALVRLQPRAGAAR